MSSYLGRAGTWPLEIPLSLVLFGVLTFRDTQVLNSLSILLFTNCLLFIKVISNCSSVKFLVESA